jgi:hypothetical protein
MNKINNWANYDCKAECNFEVIRGVDQTIPDQALTLNDILSNYGRGVPLTQHLRRGVYDDNPDIDNPDLLRSAVDIVDIENSISALKNSQMLNSVKKQGSDVSDIVNKE